MTARSGINGGRFIPELRWAPEALDWKCASSYGAFAYFSKVLFFIIKTSLNNKQTALKARSRYKLYASTVTCLEGDRPNEERIQATGRHVAGLPPTTIV
ncbi:hypothetical protein C7J99_14820 [Brevibacillus brevis]|nr:hypothetical protein C7J99_14820 [Brevibacillus brevis]GEC91435.1 hypothetical protein BBR01nite_37660 [Brevibacillus brevis]